MIIIMMVVMMVDHHGHLIMAVMMAVMMVMMIDDQDGSCSSCPTIIITMTRSTKTTTAHILAVDLAPDGSHPSHKACACASPRPKNGLREGTVVHPPNLSWRTCQGLRQHKNDHIIRQAAIGKMHQDLLGCEPSGH